MAPAGDRKAEAPFSAEARISEAAQVSDTQWISRGGECLIVYYATDRYANSVR